MVAVIVCSLAKPQINQSESIGQGGTEHACTKLGRPRAVALLALLVLPTSRGAAGLGRVVRQANFQEKAGCLHDAGCDIRCGTLPQ